MNTQSRKILFFSPYAGIWQHALPEALVAAQLQRADAEVVYVTCDGILSAGCGAMAAVGVSPTDTAETRKAVCAKCRSQRDLIIQSLGVPSINLESVIDDASLAFVDNLVRTVVPQNMLDFSVEGFSLGRFALHETVVRFKLTDLAEATPAAFAHFQVSLRHVLIAFHATKALLAKYAPDRIVTYNTHHSLNYAMMNLAERDGIPVFGLHAGGNMARRLSSLYVFRRDMVVMYRDMIRRFEEGLRDSPSDGQGIRNATDHYLALASGRMIFVYSAPKSETRVDVRTLFGIRPDQKLLLATLSSYDELFSSQMSGVIGTYPLMFRNQIEWITELIAWAEKRPDVFLLIRVHPREFPNRRDSVHSNHARALAAAFESLPPNVKINWPTHSISLYDLATAIDVGLNGWSSAGKELAFLGVPVVLFTSEILFYPASLNFLATDKENYFYRIDEALASGWSLERVVRTYRWLALEYTLATIDISDGFDFQEVKASLLRRIFNRIKRIADPLHVQRKHARALRKPLRHGEKFVRAILDGVPVVSLQLDDRIPLSNAEEGRLLRSEIDRMVTSVYADEGRLHSPLIDHLRNAVRSDEPTSTAAQ